MKSSQSFSQSYDKPDATGLYPIHWAAIYNRPDKIELMLNAGSPLKIKCQNKLLAEGTALHLASMNGSIEAAAMLLHKCRQLETRPKSLIVEKEEPQQPQQQTSGLDWLEEQDGEGQTPLMRSAAPRSKRMSTVRDLLRKNHWSLGARPAEMALFLISMGANWRETEKIYGMNLFHLAIVNNYDDIVNMLLVVDKKLVTAKAKMHFDTKPTPPTPSPPQPSTASQSSEFVAIELTTPKSAALDDDYADIAAERRPLIDERLKRQLKRDTAKNLVRRGLLPIELAIVYGRPTMVSLLWRVEFDEKMSSASGRPKRLEKRSHASKDALKSLLIRVFWSSKEEIIKFARVASLKLALVVDLTLLAFVWMPNYLLTQHQPEIVAPVFVVASSLTLALALRVIYKNPGYLAKESPEYYREMELIISERQQQTSLVQAMDMRKRVRLLCHKCKCIRTQRSRHCNYCDGCVQDFDHHCIYLGCCIGRFNRLDFLLMLTALTITATYGTIAMEHNKFREVGHFWQFVAVLWIAKYIILGGLQVFFNLRRACLGVTMYEEIRSKRIRSTTKSRRREQMIEDTFWRYTPDRFLTGDLPTKTIIKNIGEFAQMRTGNDYLLALACSDTSLARASKFF